MANVEVSKQALEKFSQVLSQVGKELALNLASAERGLSDLGQTHKDRKYEEFKTFFEQDINKHLKPLPAHMESYSNHLKELAEKIDSYDKVNLPK